MKLSTEKNCMLNIKVTLNFREDLWSFTMVNRIKKMQVIFFLI